MTENEMTNGVIILVKGMSFPPGTRVERVGDWVWITFPEKPSLETRAALISAGFHWIAKRRSWAHNCGVRSGGSEKDPREKYETEVML